MPIQRQSNIELLRCFAMLCIIVYHIHIFLLSQIHSDAIYKAIQIPLHIGAPLFVLISGYFGIHFSIKGLVRLCSKGYIYYVPLTVIPIIISNGSLKELIKGTFIFGYDSYWFLNTYLYLFLFSPIINRYLKDITKGKRIFLFIILIFMSIYIGNVCQGDPSLVKGKNLTNFILLYVLGDTLHHYQHRIDTWRLPKLTIFFLLFNTLLVLCFIYIPSLSGKIWKYSYDYNSPIIMLNSAWAFCIFSRIKIQSKFINNLGAGVFACYLIHIPNLVWDNCFMNPIRYLDSLLESPTLIIAAVILYAIITMFVMIGLDRALNPLWKLFVKFGTYLDVKFKTKQLL